MDAPINSPILSTVRRPQNPLKTKQTKPRHVHNFFEANLVQTLGDKFEKGVQENPSVAAKQTKEILKVDRVIEIREREKIDIGNIKMHNESFSHWKSKLDGEPTVVYLEPNHAFSSEVEQSSRVFPLVSKIQAETTLGDKDVAIKTNYHYIDLVNGCIKDADKNVVSSAKIMNVLKEKK